MTSPAQSIRPQTRQFLRLARFRGAGRFVAGTAALAVLVAGLGAGRITKALGDVVPRTALHTIVRTCALAQDTLGLPYPCLAVSPADRAPRTAVVRAPYHRTHVLLVPMEPIAGIEDPRLRSDPYGALWPAALAARSYVQAAADAPIPLSAIALAVNSADNRSQDQLHIHAECLRPRLLAAIRSESDRLGADWRPLSRTFDGDAFFGRLTTEADLAAANLFASLARLPDKGAGVASPTVLVVSASPRDDGHLIVLASTTRRRTVETLFDGRCHASLRQFDLASRKAGG